jgi:hypothetical protein
MKEGKKRRIGLVAVVIIVSLLFTGTIGFLTVQNIDPAPVITGTVSVSGYEVNLERSKTWEWAIGDPVDPAFDTATIKGTLAFSVLMTGDPVADVYLEIKGTSAGTSEDMTKHFSLAESNSGDIWSLAFDTTILADGEYSFTLFYIVELGVWPLPDSPPIQFSTFGFNLNDDEIVVDIGDNTLFILALGGILILGTLIVRKRRFKK